ncbi:hypothetical protein AJ79_02194 [Helicocarpus griseus UAMH5409]|uniref:MATE efflux family protein n=1 Tax=Helicocarpus griseus UAMH5409 TaxID=1447875 RepID=A0A2B7Y450_9EURO|nr:hypothetical protein AJ79_02194 [Helicocarpus griseus UAMH5409]
MAIGQGLHVQSETSPLLSQKLHQNQQTPQPYPPTPREASLYLSTGGVTFASKEYKLLLKRSAPLIITFLLEYSFTAVSIFAVGHLGKIELAATATACLTANITGYAIYQGLATSLDTLCPSSYGAGRKELVGLHCQRLALFLWCITVPIAVMWTFAPCILGLFMLQEVADLAGLYVRILVLGAPGYAAFEVGKRFMLAQGLFSATLWVLCLCAPINALLNYLFVWVFKWGFIGAPVAVVIAQNLMPLTLVIYVRFIAGYDCWKSFTRSALQDWWPIVRLALPGVVMVEAEMLAWELMTLVTSLISVDHLAAQSTISTMSSIAFNCHFPISIAAATRVSTLIGAGYSDAAKMAAKAAIGTSFAFGFMVAVFLTALRNQLPLLVTGNPEVVRLISSTLLMVEVSQLFDSLATSLNGILRGLGKQKIGGATAVFCYYVVGVPVSLALVFKVHWNLIGLAVGTAIALVLIALIEGVFVATRNWEKISQEAILRYAASDY